MYWKVLHFDLILRLFGQRGLFAAGIGDIPLQQPFVDFSRAVDLDFALPVLLAFFNDDADFLPVDFGGHLRVRVAAVVIAFGEPVFQRFEVGFQIRVGIGRQEHIEILKERLADLIFGERFHALKLERLETAQFADLGSRGLSIPRDVLGHSRSEEQQAQAKRGGANHP